VNLRTTIGTAISPAVHLNRVPMVPIHTANGATITHDELYSSIRAGRVEIPRLLLDHLRVFGMNVLWAVHGTPLMVACALGKE
jgi:hypothetical protein